MTHAPTDKRPVFIVSDGTGNTVSTVLKAALRQFPDAPVHSRMFNHVQQPQQLERVFEMAERTGALVITTLVAADLRAHATALAARDGVRHVDILGGALESLESHLQRAPEEVPGLLHRADEQYFQRIDAIEFTVQADDGKDPRRLLKADIILVGVSRTGKTPLSTYLAHKGFKVGNQPIVLDQPLPASLLQVDPRRVFALTIDPDALQRIRKARMRALRMSERTNYSDMGYILAELEYAERLFHGNRWPVIDVTNKAIEETAGTILRLLEDHGLVDGVGDAGQL